jgi:hypothetical protein
MSTTSVYDLLLAEVTGELERQVLDALMQIPHGLTRSLLISKIFGVWVPESELASSIYDRRIRKAIEHLRETWPIVSNSGEAGYRLSEDHDEIIAFAREQESRAEHARNMTRRAYGWLSKTKAISEYRKSGVKAEQPRML